MNNMPKDFKTVNRNDSFYLCNNIEKYGLSLDNSYHILPSLHEVGKIFDVPVECVIDVVKELEIDNVKLFDYTTYKGVNNRLIGNHLIYTSKVVKNNGIPNVVKTYHNVYLSENTYISVIIPKIIERLFSIKQCCIYSDGMFNKEVRRFPIEMIGKIIPKTLLTNISSDFELSCQDISDLINNPESINEMKLKSLFMFYNDYNCCFLDLGEIKLHGKTYKESLQIPYNALITRNWGLIENVNVFSIIKHDANDKLGADPNNWYEGTQKESPYMNHPLVNHLKTYFI